MVVQGRQLIVLHAMPIRVFEWHATKQRTRQAQNKGSKSDLKCYLEVNVKHTLQ
jgi:hypothetical protein